LKVNNLCFSYDSHDKEFSLKSYSVIYQKGKLNPSSVDKIKEVMIDKLGTCNIALAFDNDEAGLKYSVLSDYLREDLGITAYDSTPENIRKETDVNDILKSYNTLKVKNQEKALKLLENHMAKIEPDFECKKKVVKGNDCQIEKKNHRRP
jgi:hypothetical protein